MARLRAILGAGGTGKSYWVNQQLRKDPKFGFRTATTGIAAVNMGTIVGTQDPVTINRALGYFNSETLLRNYSKGLTHRPIGYIANLGYKNIIIDEVSMMDAGTLDLIVMAIDSFNKIYSKDLGLIILGDPGQLPPVNGKPFFEAICWPEFQVEFLTEVKRQKNQDFINALNLVRVGKTKEAAEWFSENITFTDKVNDRFRGTTFFPTNNEVDIYNRKSLNRLLGQPTFYKASITGKKDPLWKNIPQSIELKKGCIIQLLYNDNELGFANGDSAIVEELWGESIYISMLRKNKSFLLRKREINYFTFTNKGFRKKNPDGVLKLLHVRLAYALTIHKSQGLTLDSVQLNLNGLGTNFLSKQSGMLYTALSRVKTPDGLIIVGTPQDLVKCAYVDPSYLEWIR